MRSWLQSPWVWVPQLRRAVFFFFFSPRGNFDVFFFFGGWHWEMFPGKKCWIHQIVYIILSICIYIYISSYILHDFISSYIQQDTHCLTLKMFDFGLFCTCTFPSPQKRWNNAPHLFNKNTSEKWMTFFIIAAVRGFGRIWKATRNASVDHGRFGRFDLKATVWWSWRMGWRVFEHWTFLVFSPTILAKFSPPKNEILKSRYDILSISSHKNVFLKKHSHIWQYFSHHETEFCSFVFVWFGSSTERT